MVAHSSLVQLGVRLAVFLLRASDAVVDPSPGGAVALIEEVRSGWRGIAALRGQGDEAVGSFGERIALRLEVEVADVRRRCEERGVDAGLLRGAVTEVEVLLDELVGDNDVVVAAVREPDRFGEVIRGRVRRRRQNVGEAAEPFFDELVRAVTGEITRPAGSGDSQREAADGAAPSFQSVLARIRSRNPRQAVIARCQIETLALLAASGVPTRWMRAVDEGSDDAREALESTKIGRASCRERV